MVEALNSEGFDIEVLNAVKPGVETIKRLKSERFIPEISPFWWSTDYTPDPRIYIPYDKFKDSLIHFGPAQILTPSLGLSYRRTRLKDLYLYPNPTVPISVINLEIDGEDLPFVVTARPYHKKEIWDEPRGAIILTQPLEKIPELVREGKNIDILNHFLPHVRGLFAGVRKNHFFWYPFYSDTRSYDPINDSLKKSGNAYLEIYYPPSLGLDNRRYPKVYNELMQNQNKVSKEPKWVDFDYDNFKETSVDEFLSDYRTSESILHVFYPLRVSPDFVETLPLLISSKTHSRSNIQKPVVLGIYASTKKWRLWHGGIFRIKDEKLARRISGGISADFKTPVDCLLFTPQPGRPKYERIQAG